MKVTTENNVKEFILDRIESVYIGFDDNIEVKLNQITKYDFDLDKIDYSTIELTNAFDNVEIENHFSKNNRIVYVHIEGVGLLPESGKDIAVFYDIPCDMRIRRLKINKDGYGFSGDMFVELEGCVK